jgi:hypothetical protein
MRWISLATIALLLSSVQCLSACAVASCTPSPKNTQLPPCHRHHQAPVSNQHDNCDHQNAVSAPSANFALAHLGFAPAPFFMSPLIAAAHAVLTESLVLESPPGLSVSSVLRI